MSGKVRVTEIDGAVVLWRCGVVALWRSGARAMTSDSRSRKPGFQSCAAVSNFGQVVQFAQLYKEYLGIGIGGYFVCE